MNNNILQIISIDELKKALPNYSPEKADDFHTESAKLANKLFDQELKKIKNKKVVLMCGGSASGKSEFIEKFLTKDFEGIVFDSTLSNKEGAEIKINNIKKSGNIPIICLILPDNFRRCFSAFNKRDRKIPEIRFFETHCGAREVALFLAEQYQEIEFLIYQNSYQPQNKEEDQLAFSLIEFGTKKEMINFLKQNQYSKEEIKKLIVENK
jgi:hypothetical protein